MLKIRLSRKGNRNNPHFWVVVADSRSPRDGKFVEKIGHYHPCSKDETQKASIDIEKMKLWISKGAQPSESVEKLSNKYLKNNGQAELFILNKDSKNIGISKKQREENKKQKKKDQEEYLKKKEEELKAKAESEKSESDK